MRGMGVDDGTHAADYGAYSKSDGKINYVILERKKQIQINTSPFSISQTKTLLKVI